MITMCIECQKDIENGTAPVLNVKMLMECWDWVDFKNGFEGTPIWNQGAYIVRTTDDEEFWLEKGNTQILEEGFCGTAACVAGYVCYPYIDDQESGTMPWEIEVDGKTINTDEDSWAYVAQTILGLTECEADRLFDGVSSKERIRTVMNNILESRGEEIRF